MAHVILEVQTVQTYKQAMYKARPLTHTASIYNIYKIVGYAGKCSNAGRLLWAILGTKR